MITGAGGFVGRHLIDALRSAMPQAVIVATSARLRSGVDQALDTTNAQQVDELVRTFAPAAIFHLASLSFVPDADIDPEAAFRVILQGSMNVARSALRYSPDCRMAFVGSSEVYGKSFSQTDDPLDEGAVLNPLNYYASAKAAADLLMGQFAHMGLAVVRFRPFNHIGAGQSNRFVVPNFISQIVAAEQGRGPAEIKVGNLSAVRDFLDVRDVVRAYVLALQRPAWKGEILNIASGQPIAVFELLDRLIERARRPLTIISSPDRVRAVEIPRAVGDASRARSVLDWKPLIPLEETIDELFNLERRDPTPPAPFS
ncbi:NAD-dependent epimerase/dehydratase family protein [Sphingomonas natans]|uniref:NAD-dependent epimerase/dehydratase family protein n=1 Tax=Sphingomonas natans TaxID=3063330 RepID=UPI0026E2F43B|nr:GDP-mannose 4,6-dehydratase [Sphingomonas sp. BIUV-7]